VDAFGERGDSGFLAVWCDALLEVAERLSEADGLDVMCERESVLGGVACGVDFVTLARASAVCRAELP
jgi:hypothetical protein